MQSRRRTFRGALVLALVLCVCGGAVAQEAPKRTVVLDRSGFWRYYYTLRTPVVEKAGSVEKVKFGCETPLPPSGWHATDFDDSSWHRVRGAPFPSIRSTWSQVSIWDVGAVYLNASSPCLAVICMRGKFEVTDPGRVKDLKLSLAYRGGVVVRINGKEVARGHLPAGGPLTVETLAEKYPDEAYTYPDGGLLDSNYQKAKKVESRYRLRTRRLTDVDVPASLLRKGTNVLTVEVHRAPYAAFLLERFEGKRSHEVRYRLWDTCGIVGVRLRAHSADGIIPNVTRPKGFQVWNSDPLATDFDLDFGEANEPLRPVKIVGTRGGTFSGKVVVASDEPIRGLRATVGPLVRAGGGAVIVPSAVRVRYARPTGSEVGAQGHYPASVSRFDALEETPPNEVAVRTKSKTRDNWVRPGQPKPVFGAVVPIWLTVTVPDGASAGQYQGTLTITAEDVKPVRVPVKLTVHPWRMPPPQKFRTFVELIQSPDSLALWYEVPLWSDRHFKLIEESFKLLAQVGNRTVYVPLICHTNLGNAQSMVRWIKKPGGGYRHDFTVMDRYLDLYEKHCGKPEAVCLGVWEVFLEGGRLTHATTGKWVPHDIWKEFNKVKGLGPLVTSADAATREVRDLQLPPYTKDDEAKRPWKRLMEQLRERLKARGWEKQMVLGYVHDSMPSKEVVQLFRELAPGTPWMRQAHSTRKDLHGASYALQMVVWSSRFPVYPQTDSGAGWQKQKIQFPRSAMNSFPLTTFRLIGEINITGEQRGFGRLGADFWPVLKDNRGRRRWSVAMRYPKTRWRALTITTSVLGAGKDGPVSTARLEMMREGLQECEARIFIEKALLDEASRAKLGDHLVERCRDVLKERTLAIVQGMCGHYHCGFAKRVHYGWWGDPGQVGWRWYLISGWQQRSGKLFAAAAEVAKALGVK